MCELSERLGLRLPLLAVLALLVGSAAAAAPSIDNYEQLRAHRLAPPVAVPAAGLSWSIDAARWTLESGSARLQETVSGVTSGLWFEGRGRLVLAIPDAVELRQLRRLLADPSLTELELDFDRLLVRSSGGPPMSLLPAPTGGVGTESEYEKRHDHYFRIRRFDVDARILAALGDPGAAYWQADIHTSEHDWVTLTYDSHRAEELTVEWFDSGNDFLESWISLDRAADQTATGRPTSRPNPIFDLQNVRIDADLTRVARKYPDSIDGQFTTTLDLQVARDGVSVLPFELHRRAEVEAVTDAAGRPLPFIRDHFGGRAGSIDSEIYDTSLLVLLPAPLSAGSELSLKVDYSLRLPKYAGGRSWYPGRPDTGGLHDRHTADFTMTTDDRHDLQAMGELVERREAKGTRTTVWHLGEPAKMVTFAMQKKMYSKTIERKGLPPVTTVGHVGDRLSGLNEERVDEVAADTVNSLDYLSQVLDFPLPEDHLWAVLIPAAHGQAFPGFLHLGEFTAVLDTAAAAERFRAHEAGHQWWGHIVGWNSYRDQWLSEGFAEYMALMYLHDAVEGGDKIFREAITAYGAEVQGSIETAFSRFARPGNALLTARGAERMGPIGHGWRAGIGDTPTAYRTLAYAKGALVLHMLREMTQRMTGSDDAFIAILRDFVRTNAGGYASTEDFRAAVERQVPADWSWFFDQWVYGAEIPTYEWGYELETSGKGSLLLLTVEQKNVRPGFRMLVPVDVEYGKGRIDRLAVFVDEALETFEFQLPSRPRKVHFNANDAVIAQVKKR